MKKILLLGMAVMSFGTGVINTNAIDEHVEGVIKNMYRTTRQLNDSNWDKPYIYVEDIILEKGQSYDLKDYVMAFDYDLNDLTSYVVITKNNININKPGKYTVGFAVLDGKGYRKDVNVEATIVGDDVNFSKIYSATGEDEIWIEKGTVFNPLDYVWANEYSDGTWKSLTEHIVVTKNTVNPNKVGQYEVTYVVLDTKGNRIKRDIMFEVYEDQELSSDIYATDKYFPVGSKVSDKELLKGVIATDYTGLDISAHVIISENNVNFNRSGEYLLTYAVLDTNNELIKRTVTIKIYESESTIYGDDVTISRGTKFNPMDYINAVDSTGMSLNSYVLVTKNDVKENERGVYEVSYLVLDTNNKKVTKTIKVTVI